MEGVMSPLFCRALSRIGGADSWFTPFFRVSTGLPKKRKLKDFVLPFIEPGKPTIVQLMGTDAELMAECGARMMEFSDERPEGCGPIVGINFNFACPSRKVIGHGSGGGLLRDIGAMTSQVKAFKTVCPDVHCSVKIRVGFKHRDEMRAIIPALAEAGAELFFVHFRTVKEAYLPVEMGMERLVEAVGLCGDIPLIGSGDIFTPQDAARMHEISGCAGVLGARGLLKNPLLLREIVEYLRSGVAPVEGQLELNQIEMFNSMLAVARENPDKYFKKQLFFEIAAWMWGSKTSRFKELVALDNGSLLQSKLTGDGFVALNGE